MPALATIAVGAEHGFQRRRDSRGVAFGALQADSRTTTSRYLTTTAAGLQDAAKKFDLAREGFAHDSHNEDETESAEIEELSPELPDLIGN